LDPGTGSGTCQITISTMAPSDNTSFDRKSSFAFMLA
jgi:hypothetical protein